MFVLHVHANEDHHWARSVMERQVAILGEMAEDGLIIARTLKGQITEAVEQDRDVLLSKVAESLERLSRAWNRTTRAVRLSLMLQAKLIRDIDELDRGLAGVRDDGTAARKDRVMRIIGRVIDQQRTGARWSLEPLAMERLDADFCGDILNRPISELVEIICRDLKIAPHWPTLARETWAQEELDSGRPGWPLAAYVEAQGDDALAREAVNALSP